MLDSINCYSYQRISSLKQIKGDGIPRQLRMSHDFAKEKGWKMNTDFQLIDIGKSAYHGKNLDDNAALGQFIKALEKGLIVKPAVLLVENLDRLSRENVPKALQLFLTIINYGVSICSYFDKQIYSKERLEDDSTPLLFAILQMMRAHEESLVKSRRIRGQWEKAVSDLKEGKTVKKAIYPRWIKIVNQQAMIDEDVAAIIRELFDCCINKNMSYAEMNRLVREKGWADKIKRTKKKTPSNTIGNSFFYNLFYSQQVLGYYEPYNIINEVRIATGEKIKAYPAIIDENIFYQAQAAIERRKNVFVGKPAKKNPNFFKNIFKCGVCGSSYTLTCSGKKSRYCCSKKYARKTYCPLEPTLLSAKVQNILFHTISLIDQSDIFGAAAQQRKVILIKGVEQKNIELKDKKSRIDNLSELIEAGSKTGINRLVKLEGEVERIESEIKSLKQELESANMHTAVNDLVSINKFHKKFRANKLTDDFKDVVNRSLSNLIKSITVYNPNGNEKAVIEILLYSDISYKVLVFKDYAAEIYKSSKRISKIAAE